MYYTASRLAATPAAYNTESELIGDPQGAWAASKAANSFGRSAMNGRGGFGSCSGRDLPWTLPAQDTTP